MRIINMILLEEFKRGHADARSALDAWRLEVGQATWQTTHDIRRLYASADFLADNRVIFNIKGNRYRLVVKVRFQNGLVVVEWIGTHAEYSKKRF
jgi:mRNA interferase HigB